MLIKRMPLGRLLGALIAFVRGIDDKSSFPVLRTVLVTCALCSLANVIVALVAIFKLLQTKMYTGGHVPLSLLDLNPFIFWVLVVITGLEATLVFIDLSQGEYYVKDCSDEGKGFLRMRWDLEHLRRM